MNITGKDITLRALEPEDIDVLYKWENDTSIWHLSNTIAPFSRYILKQYIESSHQDIYQLKQLRLIIVKKKDSSPIGAIDLFDFEHNHSRAGIGILIGENSERNKGYGSEALDLLIDYCFRTLHLKQLFCNILENNEASINLFRSKGFEITGEKKSWVRIGDQFYNEFLLQLVR